MSRAHRIEPGARVRLAEIDPADTGGIEKKDAREQMAALQTELADLQEELYAAGTHSLLVVLQGMDTSGKDGTIRSVLGAVNPVGCRVEAFKVPTEEELAHDFLWRVHRVTPRLGQISVFNRSHYEDVLVVRVKSLVPEAVWRPRYEQIRHFESLLAASGTIVVKFFLHVGRDEQEERLLAREENPTKAWKLSAGDWRERELWDDYQRAYEEAIERCTAEEAPWYVVPADRKWFRDLAVAEVLVRTLSEHRPGWRARLERMSEVGREEVRAYREGRTGE